MTFTEQNRLLVFERRVLKKIYGPTQDNDGVWRIKTNEELENLIKKKNIVRFIKSQRPRVRWLDQVEEDLRKMKVRNWREKCKDRRLWNEIVKQAKTHRGL
jgi:hypothetical protein